MNYLVLATRSSISVTNSSACQFLSVIAFNPQQSTQSLNSLSFLGTNSISDPAALIECQSLPSAKPLLIYSRSVASSRSLSRQIGLYRGYFLSTRSIAQSEDLQLGSPLALSALNTVARSESQSSSTSSAFSTLSPTLLRNTAYTRSPSLSVLSNSSLLVYSTFSPQLRNRQLGTVVLQLMSRSVQLTYSCPNSKLQLRSSATLA